MKVMSVQNYSNSNYKNSSFKARLNGYWKEGALRILERTPAEIRELGEYFHKSTPEELVEVAKRSNFLGFRSKKESNWALNVLNNAVEQVLEARRAMQKTLNELLQNSFATAEEKEMVLDIKKTLRSLDEKFNSRHDKFFQKVELLSEEDISYFDRHKWDY